MFHKKCTESFAVRSIGGEIQVFSQGTEGKIQYLSIKINRASLESIF